MPEPDPPARFARDVEALAGTPALRMGIALSGGPDSLALLILAVAAFPGRVEAATVDHRLRPESVDEAAAAAVQAAALNVPHETLRIDVRPDGEGVQAAARAARYGALAAWSARRGLPALLTAHHADDQAETLLMRLNRGSGVAGLAGIRPARPLDGEVTLYRPLLSWRRTELAAVVAASGLCPVQDSSNADARYDRARIRGHVAGATWLAPAALARSAAALGDAEEALAFATDGLFGARVRTEGVALVLDPAGLPAEYLRRLVTRCIRTLVPAALPRGEQIGSLLAALAAGRTATLCAIRCTGGTLWRFAPAPPRRPAGPST